MRSRLSHIAARHGHGQRHDIGNVKPSGAGKLKSQNPSKFLLYKIQTTFSFSFVAKGQLPSHLNVCSIV